MTPSYSGSSAYCDTPCSGQFVNDWDGSCSATCDTPHVTATLFTGISVCQYPCDANEYLYDDSSCDTACPTYFDTVITDSRQYCQYPCVPGGATEFAYEDGSCETACPWNTVVIATERVCESPCGYQSTDFIMDDGTCGGATCNSPGGTSVDYVQDTYKGLNRCTFPCGGDWLYWNGDCEVSCPAPYTQNTIATENFCEQPCIGGDFVFDDGSCGATCNSPSLSTLYKSENECRTPCPGTAVYPDGGCEATCDSRFTTTVIGGENYCEFPCVNPAHYLYDDGLAGSCTATCVSPSTEVDLVEEDVHGFNLCTFPCGTDFLFWDGSCSATCDAIYDQFADGANNFCEYPCNPGEFLYWDGSCAATCDAPLTQNTFLGKDLCEFPCTPGQYLYWNGDCEATCDSIFTATLLKDELVCEFPCTTG
mmetsp:Transcript_23741/g.20640  ORF Transcript_23741/g.20640 Transcript_23741/m.20640 type:complete len:422 (-) Transcript_23741:3-1268(-)